MPGVMIARHMSFCHTNVVVDEVGDTEEKSKYIFLPNAKEITSQLK